MNTTWKELTKCASCNEPWRSQDSTFCEACDVYFCNECWDTEKHDCKMINTRPKTLHHLGPGTLFRDRDSLWMVHEGGDTGEMMRRASIPDPSNEGAENYNAYNEVRLVGGIYEVCAGPFRSAMFQE